METNKNILSKVLDVDADILELEKKKPVEMIFIFHVVNLLLPVRPQFFNDAN